VFDIEIVSQSLVLALQPFQVPDVLDGYCRDSGYRCSQLQMTVFKTNMGGADRDR
jgi:hypothetical protein